MGSLSNYAEGKLLDHALKTAAFTVPSALYVALSTADPLDDGSGIAEPAGGSYARVQHDAWVTAASRATSNDGAVEFPEATGSWGTVTHWAIFDAATNGNMLAHGAITTGSFAIVSGDTPRFNSGDIDISFSAGGLATYLANALLDHLLKVASYTQPTNLYMGLSTANPGDNAAGLSEPSGNGYARENHNTWNAVSAGQATNNGAITFDEANGSWGTISHWALFDALTSGNLLIYAALDTSKAIASGQTAIIADEAAVVTID